MGERTSRSGGKARQAFGKSGENRGAAAAAEGDSKADAPGRPSRHSPSNVQGALDKMAAGMGERRRAREEARERASQGESA